jgi:hypothetical protein
VVTPHLARKRAFLIGAASDLEGLHQDVQRFYTLLVGLSRLLCYSVPRLILCTEKFGFQNEDIIMMLDDGVSIQPTEANIVSDQAALLPSALNGTPDRIPQDVLARPRSRRSIRLRMYVTSS